MTQRSELLQTSFLESLKTGNVPLTIFLVNGVKLTGVISSFDDNCVMLSRDKHKQLVYKHAISTIMPDNGFVLELNGEQ